MPSNRNSPNKSKAAAAPVAADELEESYGYDDDFDD
jgi:hypothetical protein